MASNPNMWKNPGFGKDSIFVKKNMELSRENKLEAIADLNRLFAEHLGITDIALGENRQDILKMIQQSDDECFSILASFNNAWLAWDYVRSDKELKIKVEDVWKMEVERHKAAYEETKTTLIDFAAEKNINLEPLMLRINWL